MATYDCLGLHPLATLSASPVSQFISLRNANQQENASSKIISQPNDYNIGAVGDISQSINLKLYSYNLHGIN